MRPDRQLRVVLVNLCDETFGYGPSASEYLHASLAADPALRDRIAVTVLFREQEPPEATADAIRAAEPDLVGFTCYSWNLARSGAVCRVLARDPHRPMVVWGGCSFAFLRERHDWFKWWDAVDAVAIGSGEHTIVALVAHLLAGGRLDGPLPGLAVNVGGHIVFGEKARTPKSLAEVASPYLMGISSRVPRPFIEMARGCRFECAFCSDARSSREGLWATQPVDRIAQEVATVVSWPEAEWVDAGASTANVTEDHFADLCEAIRRGDPDRRLRYSFQLYPAIVRPRQREVLRDVRIGKLCFGLQSSTPETWGPMRRKSTLDHLRSALDVLSPLDAPLYVTMILGLPGETLESFRRTFDEVVALGGYHVSVHRLLVLPGTQFHLHHERHGLVFSEDGYYRARHSATMSEDDLRAAQAYVLDRAAGLTRSDLVLQGRPRLDWTNFDIDPLAFNTPRYAGNTR